MKTKCYWTDSRTAADYVASRRWESLSDADLLGTCHRGNSIWKTTVEPFGEVVVKKTELDAGFSWFEKIGREMRLRFFNEDLRDAKAALKAEAAGVPTYHPLAVWNVHKGLGTICYIMYTYVEGVSFHDKWGDGNFAEGERPAIKACLFELGGLARKMHDAGLYHRDLVPRNLLVRPDGSLAVIDFASGYPAPCLKWTRLRRTLGMASLRRLAKNFDVDLLESFSLGFCRGEKGRIYVHVLMMLLFWRYNDLKGTGGIHRLTYWRCLGTAFQIH